LPSKLRKIWWEQRCVPALVRRLQPHVLHIPYFAAPVRVDVPLVVTVHDVIPLVLPEYRASLAMRLYTALVRRTVRRATLVVTDSEWSRRDIVDRLGFPDERIRVVPLGVDERFRPAEESERTRELAARWGIRGPVVLNLGGFDVRKNLPLLVRAFARALPDLPEGSVLVIPGQAHSGNPRLYPPLGPLVRSLGLEQRVLFPGPIDEEEKVLWYRLATVYAYPSLYEGFGLSPLEAMACGTPVIAARCTSLPEVVGDAGLLVEPDERAFARALVQLVNDAELRRTLRARGLARARLFTWQRTAEGTLAAYREASELGHPAIRRAIG
jgi:glycosyltransferase involved in cell wall biosynthesis